MPNTPLIGIIMGSQSDWDTMKNAAEMLRKLEIPYEAKVMSAHRTLCHFQISVIAEA